MIAPRQWALQRRTRSRLVIKEINPFACEWLVWEFRPRVILLVRHPAAIAYSYEALCTDPLGEFRALFERAGLRWTPADAAFVERSEIIDPVRPHTGSLGSQESIDAWRGKLPPAALADLKAGYFACSLPWYQTESDW